MRVVAYDQGNPVKEGEAQISISVQRNQFPPEFIGGPYEQTVSENLPNNTGRYPIDFVSDTFILLRHHLFDQCWKIYL